MKIDFISMVDHDESSGRRIFFLARELAKMGHKVSFLSFAWKYGQGSAKRKNQVIDDVSLKYVKVARNPLSILLKGVPFFLKNLSGDICILSKALPIHAIPFLIARRMRMKRMVLDLDDWESVGGGSSLPGIAFRNRIVTTFLEERIPRISRGVVAASKVMKKRVEDMGVKDVIYLPNGAVIEPFEPDKDWIRKKRKELNISGRQRVLVYTGTISTNSYAALEFVLDSVSRLKTRNFKVVVIGDGDCLDKLKGLSSRLKIGDDVIFTGRVPYEDMGSYLSLGDIALVPYCDEYPHTLRVMCSSPRKMYEYMAAGLPVLASSIGELKEAIGKECCFSSNNHHDFIAKLTNMLRLPDEELKAIGRENKEKIRKFYNPKSQAIKLDAFLKRICS